MIWTTPAGEFLIAGTPYELPAPLQTGLPHGGPRLVAAFVLTGPDGVVKEEFGRPTWGFDGDEALYGYLHIVIGETLHRGMSQIRGRTDGESTWHPVLTGLTPWRGPLPFDATHIVLE